ncbi:serine carboxypeptidase [Athelia psychrophila]|uniref:Carboxypeptidase n=1 Tax=Athelia psychrophila TaxID=1759441 RepID=A0A166SBV7_9AGAM|nr:serine carboxypeptidase [Fibularhizoctonia sp. CBS 109695]
MKFLQILLVALPAVLAAPALEEQTPFGAALGYSNLAGNVFGEIAKGVQHIIHGVEEKVEHEVNQWFSEGKEFVKQDGLVYELVSHPDFADYRLRVTSSKLCDASVTQYSGYLDIADDKHLFFWFFESRTDPKKAPLTMWLNGGPGCSSSTGLLFELGPCSISDNGKNTTFNPYSWNTHSNIVFLDQPVNVGYSYGEGSVNNSPVAGKDVYAFIELFINRFSEYSEKPFHLAAESYGGTYAPHIASVIHAGNKALALSTTSKAKHINLASVILANGMTDNYIQMATIPEYLCDGPYPIYDDPQGAQCTALRSKVSTCQRLIQSCRDYNSKFTCVPAAMYCNSQLYGPIQQSGLNPYDARKTCDPKEDGPLCYKQMGWVETWMNTPANKAVLGVNPDRTFESCNMQINQAFMMQGDSMHDSSLLLPELIADGVRLLVYAGNADMMCNYIGNERWLEAMEHTFGAEFVAAPTEQWVTIESGKEAGTVRSAGGHGAGNVTFVTVFDAGHMVPYDQPEAALDLFTRWIMDVPLNK